MSELSTPPSYDKSFPITPSDTLPLQGPVQANGLPTPFCNGFIVLTSGNLVCRFKYDPASASPRTIPVTAGQLPWPCGLRWVHTGTTATILGLL